MRPHSVEQGVPAVSHQLFFALQPVDDVREQIAVSARQLCDELAPSARSIKPHRYHLTLRFLGAHAALPDALIAAARAAGDHVRLPKFSFALDAAGSFANRSIPWWLGCRNKPPELAELADALSSGLRAESLPADETDWVPHVTILRDADRPLPPTAIARIEWRVEEFVLIDSVLGPNARHIVLHRWHLSD